MRLTGREREVDLQAIVSTTRVTLAYQAARLMIVVGDAGSVLVRAGDRGIDHLHDRVTTGNTASMIRSQTPAHRHRTKRLQHVLREPYSPADLAMAHLNAGAERCH